jgi:tRNA(fMet)-specific endonuclease VapC
LPYIIDTNIAIHLRDTDRETQRNVQRLEDELFLSIISVVELEGGITRNPETATTRRLLLDEMLGILTILPFGQREAAEYGRIVAKIGFLRSRILDRMIAAQAIITGATLITMNAPDFRDIPDLTLEIWPSPTA